jgi:hypothetical protein
MLAAHASSDPRTECRHRHTVGRCAARTQGIATSVQRQYLGGVAGELPPDQCLPEVWCTHAEQEGRARALLHALQNRPQRRWTCACGELVEGGFEQCWNCQALMPR